MFQPAVRRKAKLRLALAGPSGSGKTYTALRLAHALAPGGTIAVLDTERGSASLYAGHTEPDDGARFAFLVAEPPDYSPETFVRVIEEAARAKVDVLILDSITHAWEGIKDEADKGARRKGGNTWAGWADARPMERRMLDAMLGFPGHVIATMRVRTEWEIQETERNGRVSKTPVKIGLKPEQRAGIEYEFTLFAELDVEHVCTVTKSRCFALADAVIRKPGRDMAEKLLRWLDEGEAPSEPAPPATRHDPTWEQDRSRVCGALGEMGLDYDAVAAWCEAKGYPRPSGMTRAKRDGMLGYIRDKGGREEVLALVAGDPR